MLDKLLGRENWSFSPPKSPDLVKTDACLFSNMKRNVAKLEATTKDEIRAAVAEVWGALDDETLAKMDAHLKRNESKVRELKGGNF